MRERLLGGESYYASMVSLKPDSNNEIQKYSSLSDSEIEQVREVVKSLIKNAVEDEFNSSEMDVMKNGNLTDKAPHKASSGEKIIYWPNDASALDSAVSDVDTDELEAYFASGHGIGFTVQ